jgi:hypothetical protein
MRKCPKGKKWSSKKQTCVIKTISKKRADKLVKKGKAKKTYKTGDFPGENSSVTKYTRKDLKAPREVAADGTGWRAATGKKYSIKK